MKVGNVSELIEVIVTEWVVSSVGKAVFAFK